ncbi:hypothetical protein [Labilibaculum euxinus]|uniref:hypothetical protein n=1 Tax=Labilibaculum euxinus TaxID=2686357 RepID=UPI00177BF8F0|nr:hypothetical protein [Labilibaculum euxinus]
MRTKLSQTVYYKDIFRFEDEYFYSLIVQTFWFPNVVNFNGSTFASLNKIKNAHYPKISAF